MAGWFGGIIGGATIGDDAEAVVGCFVGAASIRGGIRDPSGSPRPAVSTELVGKSVGIGGAAGWFGGIISGATVGDDVEVIVPCAKGPSLFDADAPVLCSTNWARIAPSFSIGNKRGEIRLKTSVRSSHVWDSMSTTRAGSKP